MAGAILDLYGLFVEQIFGGLLLSIVGLGIGYLVIMVLGRLNTLTILSILIFYVLIVGIMLNALTFFVILVGVLFYFVSSIIRFFSGGLN